MRTLLLLTVGLTQVGLLPLLAQSTETDLPSHFNNKTLLWEISGGGLAQPSYFLGTMHLLCPEDAFISPTLKAVLDRVKSVYLEVDMDDMMQMMGAMNSMMMLGDTTLSQLLNEEEMAQVKAFFAEKIPMPFMMLQRYKPMLLQAMVAQQMMPCNAGSGTESLLMAEAKNRKISIEGLETLSYQAGLFDSIPYSEQAKALVSSLNEKDDQGEMAAEMIQSFNEQDLDKMAALTMKEEGGIVDHLDLLLFNRNRNWIKEFKTIAPKGTYLFAVGAGHLPGEMGVLELLKKAGFQVRPLANNKPVVTI